MLIYFCYFVFTLSMLSFIFNRKHFLMMLLSLEFIVVILYFIIFLYLNMFNYEYFMALIFLVMTVCEGAMGLAILVFMIRVHGNDYILSFSSLW